MSDGVCSFLTESTVYTGFNHVFFSVVGGSFFINNLFLLVTWRDASWLVQSVSYHHHCCCTLIL